MTMYAIDTLEFAKRLRTSGLSQEQSEAIAEAHGQAFREAAEHTLATKDDLAKAEYSLKQDIAGVRSELKQDIAGVRSELRQDIASVRSELKQDIADVKSNIKVLKWGIGVVIIVVLIPLLKDLLPLTG